MMGGKRTDAVKRLSSGKGLVRLVALGGDRVSP